MSAARIISDTPGVSDAPGVRDAPGTRLSPDTVDQAARLRALVGASLAANLGASVAANVGASAGYCTHPHNATHNTNQDTNHTPGTIPRLTPNLAGPKLITITSGKGGVGKSNLAVSLCVLLARIGARPMLIDLDLGLANADVLCGLSPRARLDASLDGGAPLHTLAVDAPGGFKLIPGSVGLGRLPELPDDQRRRLLASARGLSGACDVLILDTGAGIGPMVRACASSADVTLVVATPEPTSIADAYALIKSLWQQSRRTGVPLRAPRLLVNQATSVSEAHDVHARISGVAERFLGTQIRLAGWVPTDPRVPMAVRSRVPFALAHPACPATGALELVAVALHRELLPAHALPLHNPEPAPGVWSRLGRLLAGKV